MGRHDRIQLFLPQGEEDRREDERYLGTKMRCVGINGGLEMKMVGRGREGHRERGFDGRSHWDCGVVNEPRDGRK